LFQRFPETHGLLADLSDSSFPTRFHAWDERLDLSTDATHLGFVLAGSAELTCASGSFSLNTGMYFSVPGECRIDGGRGFVASRVGYQGFFQVGGPVEEQGRLRYIDGCSDSLLIPPVVMGDPCLNLLYFPPGVHQTMHTHPSVRLGAVIRGAGVCRHNGGEEALVPGTLFAIHAETEHAFSTHEKPMCVIAYHPDSDFGPEHDNHPMINRTIVAGTSARYLDHIRTRSTVEVSS
jgi:hypothetical protein